MSMGASFKGRTEGFGPSDDGSTPSASATTVADGRDKMQNDGHETRVYVSQWFTPSPDLVRIVRAEMIAGQWEHHYAVNRTPEHPNYRHVHQRIGEDAI